jgi:hypothetical protein
MSILSNATQTGSDNSPERGENGYTFAKSVSAGGSGELTRSIRRNGTVERVSVRIYPGPEEDLELNIYRESTDGNNREKLVQPIGKDHIDGDDDTWVWQITEPIKSGETIVVTHDNQDSNNAHPYRVNVDVDYANGLSRFVGGLLGGGS